MGMNIYTRLEKPRRFYDDFNKKYRNNWEDKHIGKRYAAGIWCWYCKVPMFNKHDTSINAQQYDKCPSCGKSKEFSGKYNPAMRELGFDKKKPFKPTGIDGASGFTWCIDDHYGLGSSKEEILSKLKDVKWLVDEYGRKMSKKAFDEIFLQVIEENFMKGEFS